MVAKKSDTLWIYMNGEKVARLSQLRGGDLELSYAQSWLESTNGRPLSLSLPLGSVPFTGNKVHSFFDNLLPDSDSIKKRIQARFQAPSHESFDLLSHVGRDCVGALQMLPEESDTVDVKMVEAVALSDEEIAERLAHYKTMPLGMAEDEDFRISIAGAQEKTAFLWWQEKWHVPHGLTPTTHIFKLPIGKHYFDLSDSVENEWLCHLILKEFGVPVAEASIATFGESKALVVKRFDRRWASDNSWIIRLPQEDFCQALGIPPALKYENKGGPGILSIMRQLQGSANALDDRRLFIKVQFLFWLLAAIDGHGKNFSIFLEAGGRFALTPIYDVISAHPLMYRGELPFQKAKMAMALRGKSPHYTWDRIKPRHWLETAKMCGFPEKDMEGIFKEALESLDGVIEQVERQIPDSKVEEVAQPVFAGMREAREMFVKG